MSGATSKEQRRNLKKAIGAEAADAVAECRALVQQVHNQQRILATQMLENERQLAHVREGRAVDKKQVLGQGARLDEAIEGLEALALRFNGLDEADEGRHLALLDLCDALVSQLNQHNERIHRLTWWAEQRATLTRWQRFWSFVTGRCAVQLSDCPMYPTGAPVGPAIYESKNGGPLQRVSEAVAAGKPLPWKAAHEGAIEP